MYSCFEKDALKIRDNFDINSKVRWNW